MTDLVRVDGKLFARGGRRFAFNGVTYGTFRPRDDGARLPERNQIKADFAAMRDAGFTVVRTYTEPTDDLLDLAADWGLTVMAGVFWPDWRYELGASHRRRRAAERAAVAEVRQAARRLAGCEHVVAMCVGNEIPADVVRWVGAERVSRFIGELAEAVREEDDQRLVTYANYPSTEYLSVPGLDFLTFNVFLERRTDLRRYLSRLHTLAGELPLVIGELGSHTTGDSAGEAAQAAALDWQLETTVERGVAGRCVFAWTDEWWVGDAPVEGWRFGLTRHDRSPRPALDAAARWNHRTVRDLRPTEAWPSMAVVVCAYNAAATLDECLRHACALDYPGLDVVVVDDGSTDGTAAVVAGHPRARLVAQGHAGLSVARNTGLTATQSSVIAYLDADAYPTPEWPYYLVLALDGRSVGAAGGPNVPPPDDARMAQIVARAPGGPTHVLLTDDRAEHVPGCNMAFRREALEHTGGFDPVYTAAGDDVDVCWKVLDRGWEIGFHPAALVWHHRRASVAAYLRQQLGYGRAEALVAAHHPDRFNSVGAARWSGRIYQSGVTARLGQRIYRGAFGSAAFQSVYRARTSAVDAALQLAAPVAALIVLAAPLGFAAPVFSFAAAAGALALVALFGVAAWQADGDPRCRAHIGLLAVAQPVVRAWGRARGGPAARRSARAAGAAVPAPPIAGPGVRLAGGVVSLPASGLRSDTTAAIAAVLRRAGVVVGLPTGWEDYDVALRGSLLLSATLVTSEHPPGAVQIRARRRLRRPAAALAAMAMVLAMTIGTAAVMIVTAGVLVDLAQGTWRTGPRVRRVILQAAGTRGAAT